MMRIIRFLVVFVILVLMTVLTGGRGCGTIVLHPTHNAAYISSDYCMVSTEVPQDQFTVLTRWCDEQHLKAK